MRLSQRWLLLAALALAAAAPAGAEEARVTLLHTTDLHGALTAWDYARDAAAPRGLTRIATLIRSARAEAAPVLLVDAGDATEGGIEPAYAMGPRRRPDPIVAAMNALRYDAMTVGNHEFDGGWNALDRARGAARFPWLGANVTSMPGRRPLFVPSIVKQLGPVRIGIVGVTTPAVPRFVDSTAVPGIRFEDPVAAARREVMRLRTEQRCDAVVLVAHTGLERDPATGAERRGDTPDENWGYRLATGVPGVDALILGHTHVVVESAEIEGVLVTQAGRSGEDLGRVDLVFQRVGANGPWRLSGRSARVIAVTDSIADDPALAALARPYHDEARAVLSLPAGRAAHDLAAPLGRLANGATWELIHRAQVAATGADVSLAALPDPGARLAAGNLTRRDLLRLYPYGNTLGLVEMTGRELRDALEQSARYFATYTFADQAPLTDPGFPAYNYDSAWGVEYAVDLTREPGSRIVDLAFQGAPVRDDQRFKVAVNGYRMNGGGGFDAIRYARRLKVMPITVRQAIANYLANHGTNQVTKTGPAPAAVTPNWKLLPDYVLCPERRLVDRLVRSHTLEARDVLRLDPFQPASEADLERWVARLFGAAGVAEKGDAAPAAAGAGGVTREAVADACLAAARRAGYAGLEAAGGERQPGGSFRRGLVAGTTLAFAGDGAPVTRVQALAMASNARFPTLRVLETTDFHGAILPGAKERRSGRPIGGSAWLAAWIEKLRAENPEGTVLIDGGDCFQGTMISNLQFGRPVVEQMNALGYACTAIGNHEFDWSADTLERRVEGMHFAALGANMREKATGRMPAWVRSDTTFTRRGVKVSVLGLCYRFTPTVTLARHVQHLTFLDDSTVAAELAPRLRPGCDVLVGVGHIPAESNSDHQMTGGDLPRLAGVKGVDAWFGGHSHNFVNDQVNGIPFAIAGSHGNTIAVCDMTVDPVNHAVTERALKLVTVYADSLPPDSVMAARVERWNKAVAPVADQVLGDNTRLLTRGRGGESTVGDFVADAIREVSGADIAMQNSGGLRADLQPGKVTRGAIYEVMPFDNMVYTMKLTGAEVKLALEQALKSGRVTQVSGIMYTFDTHQPEMQRVMSLSLADGKPLDPAKLYTVAVNDFMATGGDDYAVLSGGKDRTQTDVLVRDELEQLVIRRTKAGKALDYDVTGRIKRVGSGDAEGGGGGH